MKHILPFLKLGQKILARIIEIPCDGEVVANFSGDLARIKNLSNHSYKIGDEVLWVVSSVRPLQFKVATLDSEININIEV
ncbi:MAG: hypothetical protein SGJ18_04520 [Pseudomonadota bacterium]|nr:hypothetical protein [Pseudomonadota bacterium]